MPNKVALRLKTAAAVLFHGRPLSAQERGGGRSQTNARSPFDIPAISPEEVAEARSFFPMEKFFIFGHARSGTTLLTRLVRVHPQVYCNYQAHFFSRPPLLQALVTDAAVTEWLARRSNRWNRGRDLSPVVLRAAADFIMEREARKAGKTITGDKSPNSLLDGDAVRLLVRVYPDAHLIFIIRDGRDAAISHRFQAFIDNPKSLNRSDLQIRQDFTDNPEPFLNGQRSIFSEKALRLAAEGWKKNIQETNQAALELLGGGAIWVPHQAAARQQYMTLRYEDLLGDPHREMGEVWAFLGADPAAPGLGELLDEELTQNPDADWQQEKAGEIAGALQKGKSGSWQSILTSQDKKLFWEIAGNTLSAWGYGAE